MKTLLLILLVSVSVARGDPSVGMPPADPVPVWVDPVLIPPCPPPPIEYAPGYGPGVPEPAACAVLLGIAALGVAAWRRRR